MFTLKITGEGCDETSWYADLSQITVHGYITVDLSRDFDILGEVAAEYPNVINDADAVTITALRETVKHACVATAWDSTQSRHVAFVFPNGHGYLLNSTGDTIDRVR